MRSTSTRWAAGVPGSGDHRRRSPARFMFIAVVLLTMVSLVWTPNSSQAQTVPAPPVFSSPRGFYSSAFNLTLTSPTGASIRYTLNGATPTHNSGTLYSGPIAISTTSIVRALAYTSSSNKSAVVTHTYVFLASVRNQPDTPPPGWPTKFSADDDKGTYPSDYEMDPQVWNHPNNTSKFNDVMQALPTMSIVTDLPNLFDPSFGIYYNPSAKESNPETPDPLGNKWERPMSIEWINPDGTTGFAENGGMRIHGQASRRPNRTPKHSFRIYFKKAYGVGSIEYRMFDVAGAATKIDRMVLRNGGNRSWPYFDRDQRRDADYVNDEWARRTWGQMGHLTSHGTYVHLYLNGLYWGLYNVAERIDEKFLTEYLGLLETDYDLVESAEELDDAPSASVGDLNAWNELLALVNGTAPITNAEYQNILTKVDAVSLADYFVHVHYIGKTDWPDHNWNMYRQRIGPDTRFKFIAWDNDSGLNKVTQDVTILTETPVNGILDSPLRVFDRLATNAEFRQLLADRLYKHVLDPTGALAPANCAALYTELTNIVDQAVIGESGRWGDYMRDKYPRTNVADKPFPAYLHSRDLPNTYTEAPGEPVDEEFQKTWLDIRNEKLATYCPNRGTIVMSQYEAQNWYQNTVKAPGISQRGGIVAANGTVTLNNTPNSNAGAIYYTTNGVDPRAQFGAVAAGATLGNDQATITVPRALTLKARVLNGSTWSPMIEYTFAPAQPLENLVINEIHYHPSVPVGGDHKLFEFIELYNKGATSLQLDRLSFLRGMNFQFPANTNIAPGQFIVLASNAASFQSRYGFAPFGVYTGSFANEGEPVEMIDAVGNGIERFDYLTTAPWPTGLSGTGYSLSLYHPAVDNSLPENWRASTVLHGTPGAWNGHTQPGQQTPQISWAIPAAISYGTALSQAQLNAAISGSPVAGTFSYDPPLGTVLQAGNGQTLTVHFTPNDTTTYTPASASVLIDVTKVPLTITAENKIKTVGAANPALTATYSGFVNGDDATMLDTPAVLSTTATTGSPEGNYPISVTGATDNNYNITFVNGTLMVTNKAIPVITWANPAQITYGTPLGSAQLNASSSVAGTFTYTPGAGTVLPAGNGQTLSVTFTPANTATHISVTQQVTINVARAPLTIRASNKSKQVGATNPPLTAIYQGFVNGDNTADLDTPAVLSTTATTNSPVGSYPITVAGATDSNYTITFVNGTLTVVNVVQETEYRILLPVVQVK